MTTTSSIDTRLVRLGLHEPRAALVEQGQVSEGVAKEFATTLNAFGWSDAKTKTLHTTVELLQSNMAMQADHQDDSKTAHGGEAAAKVVAKALIRKLRLAWPMALRDAGTKAGVAADAIESGGALGTSSPRIVAYLTTVEPAVKTLEPFLKPYFGGTSPLTSLVAARTGLQAADTTQELELDQVPESTQRIYEAKGRLLELISDLNRVGQIAFDGQAATLARFNKDILLRARHKKAEPQPVA